MHKNVQTGFHLPISWKIVCALVLLLCATGVGVMSQPKLLTTIPGGSKSFVTNGGVTYFASGDTLWRSDGTTDGTQPLKKLGEAIYQVNDLEVGGTFLIVTYLPSGHGLWKSDGTEAGTVKLGSFAFSIPTIVYNGSIYLGIDDGIHGHELWKYTPPSQLQLVKDIYPGTGSGFPNYWVVTIYNDVLFFKGQTADGADIWKTTGTEASTQYAVNASAPFYELEASDGYIYFDIVYGGENYTDQTGEIWRTQGTQETTSLVKRFISYPYVTIFGLTELNGTTVFMEGNLEDYLYRTEGTEETTTIVKQVASGEESFVQIGPKVKNNLIIWDDTQTYPGVMWRTDGTTEGTQVFHDLADYRNDSAYDWINLTAVGDLLFFADIVGPWGDHKTQEIFQSDLTSAGTKPLSLIFNMSFKGTDNITALGDDVLFTTMAEGETEKKLWFYDPNNVPTSPCANTGGVVHELWKYVNGTTTSTVPVNTGPNEVSKLSLFEGPTNIGDHYGSRYRALLCVPQTGDYRFWIASNDHSDLFLSTDENPANKQRIAYVNGATTPRQYNKYASQQSALIRLEQGKTYYIEALHKEGVGTDHISVGMQLPDGTLERPITGARLVPYGGEDGTSPFVTLTASPEKEEYNTLEEILFTADVSDDGYITRVEFRVNDMYESEVFSPPYESKIYFRDPGTYDVTARVFDDEGNMTVSDPITVVVTGCLAKGYISHEVWWNVYGVSPSDVPTDRPADAVYNIPDFEAPSNIGDHYGSRIRGYICPPVTGNYEFEIPSNDQSELWLSTDEDPANKVRIAYAPGASAPRTIKFSQQRSAPIYLEKHKRYYIEAIHKEGVGTDHVSVGWRYMISANEGRYDMPIPGTYLSPFEDDAAMRAASTPLAGFVTQGEAEDVLLTPNPAKGTPVKLQFKGYDEFLSGELRVNITSAIGATINEQSFDCDNGCEDVTLNTESLTPGVYVVNGIVNGRKFSKKLLVK